MSDQVSTVVRKEKTQNLNVWLLLCGESAHFNGFSFTVGGGETLYRGAKEGDGCLIAEEREGVPVLIAVGQIYRKRIQRKGTTFLFDSVIPVEPGVDLASLGIMVTPTTSTVSRLDWSIYESAVKLTTGQDPAALPLFSGQNTQEQAYVRELLQFAVVDDLLGPACGPEEEIVGMGVRDRYLVGKLAPKSSEASGSSNGFEGDMAADGEEDGEDHIYEGRHEPGGEFSSAKGKIDAEGDEAQETDSTSNQSLVPSSMGITFCVAGDVESLKLEARWGRYERGESQEQVNEETGNPLRAWIRIPSGGIVDLPLTEGVIKPKIVDTACPDVRVVGSVRGKLASGDRLVTLFLVNDQEEPEQNRDSGWIFQPELILRDEENRPIFRKRPVLKADGSDEEREALEMIYRKQVEFAVGHGVSVHAIPDTKHHEHAVEVRTQVLPEYEVPITETPGLDERDRTAMQRMVNDGLLDMTKLADMPKDDLVAALHILTDDYETWIGEQKGRIAVDVNGFDASASKAMDSCEQILQRLRDGIAVLGSGGDALEAFRFANRAMALQRVRGIYSLLKRRGEKPILADLDVRKNRSWRPFQLAFILLSLPALADPCHTDRTEPLQAHADLLWFPTGGGKTEAYLGVAAFTMGIRRLQGNLGGYDAGRGLAVIMRYTLRLLTLQQFQRASTLLCAMEVLRRADPKSWGEEPFSLGLWVGQKTTPNSTEESHQAIQKARDGSFGGSASSPAQLTFCPWCGAEIAPGRDVQVCKDTLKTMIFCGDSRGACDFGRANSPDFGLPVRVVDEEIYLRPPTMLIATVDKFAMMAWKGQVRNLFGRASQECPRHGLIWPNADCNGNHTKKRGLPRTSVREIPPLRPPDLIIQDEFHLISGPLGTMVGLYETAIDELSTWSIGDQSIRPKVIASTATVRKATEQVKGVFLRKVAVFPPHGLDVEDNFFSVQRSVVEKPGRLYIGICSPGSSRPAVLIRVYTALLTAAQELFNRFGAAADPYMTTVGYFNSLRELGGMKRLCEDDVQTRSYRVGMSHVRRPGLAQRSVRVVDELTSRVSNRDIPIKLDQMELKFKKVWKKGDTRGIDVVLATNMLSVGVDVNRLGLMAVNGQPKGTAEYIQATSRVGRSFPGLVCTVLTWARPRDLSHYETYEHYHATFYKHVEAQSVTPFAPRAMDRGLTGAMVSMLRLGHDEFNPNLGAEKLDTVSKPEAVEVKGQVVNRGWKVTGLKETKIMTEQMIGQRVDDWVAESIRGGRDLGYDRERKAGTVAPLLKRPGVHPWDRFTVPMSMREVEPGVRLIMDSARLGNPPEWVLPVKSESDNGGDQ
jgi:hypothetical protein